MSLLGFEETPAHLKFLSTISLPDLYCEFYLAFPYNDNVFKSLFKFHIVKISCVACV